MAFLYSVIMGIIQGITEFLPVSSSGHLAILQKLLGIREYTGLPLSAFLHLGSLTAIVLVCWNDVYRISAEIVGMGKDLYQNFLRYVISGPQEKGSGVYRKILNNNYRRLAALLGVTAIPTALIGFTSRNLALKAGDSLPAVGIGFLITGMFLLVVDFVLPGEKHLPKEMGFDCAMWIGIAMGLAAFPGVSGLGLALAVGMLCGLKKSFAVKYAVLASVPAIFGAFLTELWNLGRGELSVGLFFCFLFGLLLAGGIGFLILDFLLHLVQHRRCRIFAFYSFVLGIAAIILQIS